METQENLGTKSVPHKSWVKSSHWIITISFFLLVFTGFEMIMVHPRFYWGNVGNDLTPAMFELPVSRNYKHGGWETNGAFFDTSNSPVSASRTYDIFNENGWGRSLHFLSAWVLVIVGTIYLLIGIFSGYFREHIVPRKKEFKIRMYWHDFVNHLRMLIPPPTNGPHYGLLQKSSYLIVIFFFLPLITLTGFTCHHPSRLHIPFC